MRDPKQAVDDLLVDILECNCTAMADQQAFAHYTTCPAYNRGPAGGAILAVTRRIQREAVQEERERMAVVVQAEIHRVKNRDPDCAEIAHLKAVFAAIRATPPTEGKADE